MPMRRFERVAHLFSSGCVIVFAAGVMIEHAQAQYIPPPTPLPPPVFNPSSPYTVPQPSYRSIAPSTPSAAPGYVSPPPVSERVPREATRSEQRKSVAPKRSVHRRGRATAVRATPPSYSSYYSPFGYGCAWQRGWDGYWFRTSPCL